MREMKNSLFYRNITTKEEAEQFEAGFKMAEGKTKTTVGLRKAYKKAVELSTEELDLLNPAERGFVSKVYSAKLEEKGGVLDAYNICLNTGVLYDISKKDIEEKLIYDAANSSLKYMNEVKSFIEDNEIAKTNLLEIMVHTASKKKGAFGKISKASVALVVAGFLFSGYNITGNVIGNSMTSGKLVGALLFSVGLIWMTVSMKKETAKIC